MSSFKQPIALGSGVSLDPDEITMTFIRSRGPGGQNVNRVESAVQLRFDVAASASLPEALKPRILALAGRRATRDGVIVIEAQRFRHQARNREDAVERLVDLLRRALIPPTQRRASRVPTGQRRKRMDSKKQRGETKAMRQKPRFD